MEMNKMEEKLYELIEKNNIDVPKFKYNNSLTKRKKIFKPILTLCSSLCICLVIGICISNTNKSNTIKSSYYGDLSLNANIAANNNSLSEFTQNSSENSESTSYSSMIYLES